MTKAIVILLETDEVSHLTYDYDKKRILYDGEILEPKMYRKDFGLLNRVEIGLRDLQDALYTLARDNSPKPETEEDIFLTLVETYLINKQRVTIPQILKDCFSDYTDDLTDKQLEYRISEILKQLKWLKKRSGNTRYWHRETK